MKVKTKDLFWYIYFIILALPLHQSNGLLGYLSITGMVSIFHVLMILVTIYSLFKGRMTNRKTWIKVFVFMFVIGILFGVLMGVNNNYQFSNVLGDGGMYLLAFMFLLSSSSSTVRGKDLNDFLLFTYRACTIMLTINLIMYVTRGLSFWKMISFNEGRYFGGFLAMLIITIPYGLYNHIHLGTIRLANLAYHILLGFICMIIAQSRATVIASVIGITFVLYFGNKKFTVKNLIHVLLLSAVAFVALSFLMRSSFDVINRILSTDFSNRSETSYARVYLYQYYTKQIVRNPMGSGFGSIMYFLTPQLNLMNDTGTYTVDAALLSAGYKGGWVLLGVFLFAMAYEVFSMVVAYKNTKDKLYLTMIVCQMLFIVSTGLITGQIIHTYSPLVYFWTFMGVCITNSAGKSNVRRKIKHGSIIRKGL